MIAATPTFDSFANTNESETPIDRQALVMRHNIETRGQDWLMVGNGEIALNADFTGLQSFEQPGIYAHWAWHTAPLPDGEHRNLHSFRAHGRIKTKMSTKNGWEDWNPPAQVSVVGKDVPFNWWLRTNPHPMNLGALGFEFYKSDGAMAEKDDLLRSGNPVRRLDLWTGLLISEYALDGDTIRVQTCVHPELDAIAIRVESELVRNGRLNVTLKFPYSTVPQQEVNNRHPRLNNFYDKPDYHVTETIVSEPGRAILRRQIDEDGYYVNLAWKGTAATLKETALHSYNLATTKSDAAVLETVVFFAPKSDAQEIPDFTACRSAAATAWEKFWKSGAAIDLSGSRDSRWLELERRIVLSQYLLRANNAGTWPPAEAGLAVSPEGLADGWYGKFHMEMYWWHAAHFALWDRWALLERSVDVFRRFHKTARETAHGQGYRGARWPKMTAPGGWESPSMIGPFIIWQQPHPIHFAEADYRLHPTPATLAKWDAIVEDTAEFMASYVKWDEDRKTFNLGPGRPGIATMPENNKRFQAVVNPTFELSYWRYGLRTAQVWRERLGRERKSEWDTVLDALAALPVKDGLYLMEEGMYDTFTKHNWEHPGLIGVFGMLPGDGVDPKIARSTVRKVWETWQWDRCWGWDFPMMAMAAARVGEPGIAVDILLRKSRKNTFLQNGWSTGGPMPYFPSNGGLLYAVAMMAAGWDGGPDRPAPGFPDDGSWVVRAEGFNKAQ